MTQLEDLEQEAASLGIITINVAFDGVVSFSLKTGDKCLIGIDPAIASTGTKRAAAFAHELGHCETGAFYNTHSSFDLVGKHEHRAWKWAVQQLIPREQFLYVYAHSRNIFELSEELHVTEELAEKACEMYL